MYCNNYTGGGNMKKFICILICAVMAVGIFSGCGAKNDVKTKDNEPKKQKDETGLKEGKEPVELIIESWRMDDLAVWQDKILPAFHEKYPNIKVDFRPVINTEYGTSLPTKLTAGTAGDIIMVEPYDFRVKLYEDGLLEKLNDIGEVGTENFEKWALSAWSTDDGDVFAVPLASVLHGFIYNKDIFKELGLTQPETEQEFLELLEVVKKDGKYIPLAMGTASSFVPGILGFDMTVPNYSKGEEGRLGLIEGTQKFTDAAYVDTWKYLQKWIPYLPEGYESIAYSDMQNIFTLGKAAVYPAGSWEISIFNNQIGDAFELGAFAPPVKNKGDQGYINNHPDMGLALNAKTKHPEEARIFLKWITTAEFANLWNDALPGFFNLTKHKVEVKDQLAQTYLSWLETNLSTPRIAYQILSRGEPNTDAEINRLTTLVMNNQMTPEEAAETIQKGLESWYTPKK
jgi:raffinose/stachyose/melibiose transport system substrate-binding protein